MAQQTTIDLKQLHPSQWGTKIVGSTRGDRTIWAMAFLLAVASMLVVYSSTGSLANKKSISVETFLFKQAAFISLGMLLIYGAHKVNYMIYARIAKLMFVLSIPLLIYTLFFGVSLNEGSRWIKIPVINMTIQSSDFAKLALFMFLSLQLSRKQKVIKDFKKGFPVVLICGLIAPANLSTSLLVFGTCLILMFIGRVNTKHLGILVLSGVVAMASFVLLSVSYYDKETGRSKELPAFLASGRIPTWMSRIQVFVYSTKETAVDNDKSFQINQAKIAIANGGWIGLGPGNSLARNFLPHSYSDFIYAIILEEYGLLGGVVIMLIYLIFLFRCIRLFKRCPFAYGAFLAMALGFSLVIQAFANMGVNVNLLPNTGVTLPLVSMGGSSFLFTCISIGIILSVARNVELNEGTENTEVTKSTPETDTPEPAVA
jgi:cell division protein FtsW